MVQGEKSIQLTFYFNGGINEGINESGGINGGINEGINQDGGINEEIYDVSGGVNYENEGVNIKLSC